MPSTLYGAVSEVGCVPHTVWSCTGGRVCPVHCVELYRRKGVPRTLYGAIPEVGCAPYTVLSCTGERVCPVHYMELYRR